MENSNAKIKDFLLSWLTSCSNKFSDKITSFGFSIPIITVGENYEITLNNTIFSYTAITGDSSVEVLTGLKLLIDGVDYYQTDLIDEKLIISLNSLDYFLIAVSENINATNENGVIVIEAYNNTGTEISEILSNMKPEEFPFITFKISNQSHVAEETIFDTNEDKYVVHKNVLIDLNFYDPTNYMDLAEYVMAGLKFESTILKRKSLFIGVINSKSPILNVSAILGGKSEGRANTILNLSVATTFYDTGINGIINVESIEDIAMETTLISDNEVHNNTINITKEL